ncbi:hypothetical protein BU25DRAFT_309521, partial [Macroventuria anomochaeta]
RDNANQQLHHLSQHQEYKLCTYIEELTDHSLPPTRQMVQNFASGIAHVRISESWVTRFLNHHRDTLLCCYSAAMDAQRHYANSSKKYAAYFTLLHSK